MSASASSGYPLFVLLLSLPLVSQAQVPSSNTGPVRDSTAVDSVVVRPVEGDSLPPMRVHLPPLTVKSSRNAPASSPTGVTTLDFTSRTERGGRTVDDLLAARTNLFVKQRGTNGRATVSARGLGSHQTRILVDGQRIADPQTGQTDLSLLPSVLIESARIVRGAQGGRYGSGTLGGVVQLETLQPSDPLRIEATTGMGAFGWRSAGGVVSLAGTRWSGLVAAEGTWTDGDFSFENESLVPPTTQHRRNADRKQRTVFGTLMREGEESRSSATLWWNNVDRGLPGTINASPSDASQRDRQWRFSVEHRRTLPNGQLRLTARGQDSFLRFQNPDPDPRFAEDDTTDTRRASLKATADITLTPQFFLSTGTTIEHDRAALRGGVNRWRVGAFVDGTWSLGRLTLHPALRLDTDHPSGPGRAATALSPQLGAIWQPGPSWLRLKGQIGRSFRTPTFNERFFVPGGNPTLRAESGWSAETGIRVQVGSERRALQTEVTGFTTRLSDQIVWQPSFVGPGLQVWRPSNVGTVRTRGVEWMTTARWALGSGVAVDGRLAFTHVSATNRSNPQARAFGRQLPNRPKQRLKTRAGVSWRSLRLAVSSRLVGRRYVTADESQALDPFQVTDARIEFTHTLGPAAVTASIRVRNLFDSEYNVVRLHPMPPRHVRTRLTLSLTP